MGFSSGNYSNSNNYRKPRAVSELRFNLPSSEVLFSGSSGSSNGNKDGGAGGGNRSNRLSTTDGGATIRSAATGTTSTSPPRTRDQIHDQFHKILRKVGGDKNHPASTADEDSYWERFGLPAGGWSEDRLDLSLGREKAGGGNRGSRAKMGKLIIADDGLKMLDLVVAANVGVWWTTWERTFGEELLLHQQQQQELLQTQQFQQLQEQLQQEASP